MPDISKSAERLKYADISMLPSAAARLAGVELRSPREELLGRLIGVLLTAQSGHPRYTVVQSESTIGPRAGIVKAVGVANEDGEVDDVIRDSYRFAGPSPRTPNKGPSNSS